MGFCVTNDKTGTGGIFEEAAAGKAPEQDHDQRYHRGLRGEPHDLLLPFQGHLRSGGLDPCRGCRQGDGRPPRF